MDKKKNKTFQSDLTCERGVFNYLSAEGPGHKLETARYHGR